MINKITSGWNIFRFIRLAIGLFILVEGIRSGVAFFMFFGAIFTVMPLLNMGCCTISACGSGSKVDELQGPTEDVEFDVVFEELEKKE